ncbi:hypothetical protein ACX9I7_01270 [Streptomyces sp. L500]
MPENTALLIEPNGSITELDLGDQHSQAKALARKLLDAPAVITYIHSPAGGWLAVIGGKNRAQHLPNLFAGLAIEELGGQFHDTSGAIVFTGYLTSGHLTGLPAEAAALIRDICPTSTS